MLHAFFIACSWFDLIIQRLILEENSIKLKLQLIIKFTAVDKSSFTPANN